MVFAVTRGGSFSGSVRVTIHTNTFMPGRSERPLGFMEGSKRSLRTERSVILLSGQSSGSWSRTHERANQTSQMTDIIHSHMAS